MKKAIATLLSVSMMFSILAQGPAVYAEGLAVSEPAQQEEIAAEALLQAALPATPETGSEAETPDAQQAPAAAETPDGEQPLPAEEPETLAEESELPSQEETPELPVVENPAGVEVGVLAGVPLPSTSPICSTPGWAAPWGWTAWAPVVSCTLYSRFSTVRVWV